MVLHPLYRVFLEFLKQTTQSDCRPVYRPWVDDLDGTGSGRTLVQGPPRQAPGSCRRERPMVRWPLQLRLPSRHFW